MLGYYFFEKDVGPPGQGLKQYWQINTDEARVLVLIHELQHDLTRHPHTDAPGETSDEMNQEILKTCMGINRSIPKQ